MTPLPLPFHFKPWPLPELDFNDSDEPDTLPGFVAKPQTCERALVEEYWS